MDSVNSTTFIKRPPDMTDTQEKFLYTKELLSGRIFVGYYQERRYVSVLKEYRDVVVISTEEEDLYHDLNRVRQKWSNVKNIKWVGITGPDTLGLPKAYCFWLKLSNLAFGQYWFQIKHVKLLEGELFLQLKCIRKFQTSLFAINSQSNSKHTSENNHEKGEVSTSTNLSPDKFVWNFNLNATFSSCQETINFLISYITWSNFFSFIRIASALTIVLIMSAISIIGQVGEFVLKLIRELTYLVNSFTPIVLQLIDFLSKIVGGFYILIAGMFFRNGNHIYAQPKNVHYSYSIPYSNVNQVPSQKLVDWRERNRLLRQELLSN